jgi:hypothetical protein
MAAEWPAKNILAGPQALDGPQLGGRERDAVSPQRVLEGVRREIGMLAFTQRRERVEALKLGVHETGMTHHHAIGR